MILRVQGHPVQQMARRGVTKLDIESAVANRHTSFASDRNDSITYIGPGVDGSDLKVWVLPPGYVDEETTIIVKSVAWKNREDPT